MIRSSKPVRAGLISRTALVLGAMTGAAMLATPAMAAKEPKPAKQAPLKLSPAFQKLAVPLQTKINAAKSRPEVAGAQGKPAALASALAGEKAEVDAAFAAASTPDDRFVAGQFALSLGSIAEDPALQRKGVDAMLQSGKSSPADTPKLHFYAGQLAYQAKDFAGARQSLMAAAAGGYTENDPYALLAEISIAEGKTAEGLGMLQQSIDKMKAAGTAVPEAYYRRGLLAAYKAKAPQQASSFAAGLVQSYPTTQNWGIAITIVREISGIPGQDMLDLLRLMGRTNSYNEGRDYLEYIEAADARRLPGEVLKVIDAGVASGKLSASDQTVRDARAIASERLAADKASLPGLERDSRAANASAVTVVGGGDAFLSYGDAAKAEALYTIALGKAGVDQPRALTRLGIAQVDQGKYAEAQATFAKVTGPRKPIADLWTAYAISKSKPGA